MIQTSRLNEDEQFVLNHIIRWGSDGYPINKLGKSGWSWGPMRSVNGPPVVFKTKREAVASFERYYELLLDRNAGRL